MSGKNDQGGGSLVPPHSLDGERAVLGAVLRDPDCLHVVADQLKPEHFFIDAHGKIFEIILQLYSQNETPDFITVADKLRRLEEQNEKFSPPYLVELTEVSPYTQNIEYYAGLVKRYYFLRKIILTCQGVIKKAFVCDGSVESFIEDVEKDFLQISSQREKQGIVAADKVLETTIEQIQKNLERGDKITGIPTGFNELDELSGGWQRSDLVILAARPGMGKTALALNFMMNAVKKNHKAVMFTLEMSKEQLMSRVLSSEGRVDSSRLRKGDLADDETDRLMEAARNIYSFQSKLGIDETPSISLVELRSRCRRYQKENGLDLVLIDYLQLMGGSTHKRYESREREISEISMGLKALAKELQIPVIALAQLNRSPEGRPDKKPRLSDLRESGSMEQDADMILFVFRDEYYNVNTEKAGVAELVVGKNRHGPVKSIELAYLPNFVSFQNLMKV